MRQVFGIAAAIGGVYGAHAWIFGPYVADDAGISLAYARNLVRGYGPVLYPGGEAVEGFSNPLWTAIIALFSALRLDGGHGILLLKILGLVTGAAVLVLTARSRRVLYPGDRTVTWLAPLLLAVWTSFVFWSGAGLENPLYALLLLAAAAAQMRELEAGDRRPWSAILLLGVATTRPEGVAFVVPFLAHRVLVGRRVGEALRWAAIFLVPFALFIAARYAIFGDFVPNTYHAKISDRSLGLLPYYLVTPSDPGITYVGSFAIANLAVMALAVIGLLDLRAWRTNLLMGGIFGGMALYAIYAGGDFWPEWRFLTGILPLLALAAQHGVHVLAAERRALGTALASVCVVILAYQSLHRTREVRRLSDEGWFVSLQGRLEQARRIRALADQYGIADPLYVDPDIGGPSVAGLRVLDLAGLADIHIATYHYYPPFFRDYIFRERRPHIIRTHGPWTYNSRITSFPEFHEQYVAIHSREDPLGLHGEFVRRDIVEGTFTEGASPRAGASFSQAVADTRARRERETDRKRDGWIDYYRDHGYHGKLRRAFEERKRAGTLPTDPTRLTDLYFALLDAGDIEAAEEVRKAAGRSAPSAVRLSEAEIPRLELLDHRTVHRGMPRETRLQLFVRVLSPPARDYVVQLALRPDTGGEVQTITHEMTPPTSAWPRDEIMTIDVVLGVDEGKYSVDASFVEIASHACLQGTDGGCRIPIGAIEVRR